MRVQLMETVLVDDTNYIDILNVDGRLITQHLTKTAEPNEFGLVTQEEGNTSAAMKERLLAPKSSEETAHAEE